MPVEVVMPKFGLTMQEGKIQQWFKAEGDAIETGQPLFEVETEKVLYEVEAPASGVVAKLLYPLESTVPCAKAVAVIAVGGEDPAAIAKAYASTKAPETGASTLPHAAAPASQRTASTPAGAIVATPAARKLAKERGIDLATVKGTGPGGRITREDVEAAAAMPQGTPLHGMRKSIADRMFKSLQSTAQLTITTEADVTPLVARREQLKKEFNLTFTDMLIEAVAGALVAHPRLRLTVEGDLIQPHEEVNVGIAVALDEGLMVPVIRHADTKSLQQIADESRRLAEKARAGSLGVDEVSGGTFTITNLGMYGIDAFTPIINQPQIAILGVGRIVPKPAVHDGQIAIRSMMTLSLTFDHRIVDGAPAAAFLQDVAARLSRS
ncbi:MAG TPA: dihydrolipoamide acetyltransferase family protein [Candidatus Binatia bacterium]